MKIALACLGAAAALTLAACGDRMPLSRRLQTCRRLQDIPDLPLQTPRQADQAPIVPLQTAIHVGADVAPPAGSLQEAVRHGETGVSYGTVQDGIGAAELIAYLEADAAAFLDEEAEDGTSEDFFDEGQLLRFGGGPPTVYVADGTPPTLIDETVRVVQAINAALPQDWQLRFSRDPATAANIDNPDGKILVRFALQIEWPRGFVSPTGKDVGLAVPSYRLVQTGRPGDANQNRDRRRPGLRGSHPNGGD